MIRRQEPQQQLLIIKFLVLVVCDGGATVTMAGGNPAFTYLWSNGETTDVATALCVGVNSVDVTDALGCVASATVTITEPAVLTAAITSVQIHYVMLYVMEQQM